MSVFLHSKKRTLIVSVKGDFDLVCADEFRQKVDKAWDEIMGRHLLVDLTKVKFIDSSGLGVILGRFRKIKAQQGIMVLYGMNSTIRRILELSGIMSLIYVVDNEKDAWKIMETSSIKEA